MKRALVYTLGVSAIALCSCERSAVDSPISQDHWKSTPHDYSRRVTSRPIADAALNITPDFRLG